MEAKLKGGRTEPFDSLRSIQMITSLFSGFYVIFSVSNEQHPFIIFDLRGDYVITEIIMKRGCYDNTDYGWIRSCTVEYRQNVTGSFEEMCDSNSCAFEANYRFLYKPSRRVSLFILNLVKIVFDSGEIQISGNVLPITARELRINNLVWLPDTWYQARGGCFSIVGCSVQGLIKVYKHKETKKYSTCL